MFDLNIAFDNNLRGVKNFMCYTQSAVKSYTVDEKICF